MSHSEALRRRTVRNTSDGMGGTSQTAAFEIEDGVFRALYVVRNPDKLRHLAVHGNGVHGQRVDLS